MSNENEMAQAPVQRLVGQPLYAVFAKSETSGEIQQLSIPLSLSDAKDYMRLSKMILFKKNRRIRRLHNTKLTGPAPTEIK